MLKRFATAIATVGVVIGAPVQAVQYTVGPDATCDFSSLTTAIAAASSGDVLYVTNGSSWSAPAGGFQITKSLSLVGTTSCAQYDSGLTTLEGDGSSSVLEISGSGITVSLWRIGVTGGGTDADHGGGIEVRGGVILNLADAHIDNNDSDLGGGIYFAGTAGAGLTIYEGSGIQRNAATDGAGLYCTGPVAVTFSDGSISVNTADLDGGGIWLGDGASLTVSAGGLFMGVTFNDAGGNGAGIYSEGDSEISFQPGGAVTANEADGDGGGVFITGTGNFSAINTQIISNSAGGNGGGVYASAGATVNIGRPAMTSGYNDGCPLDPPRCSILSNNSAGVGGSGGAIYATGDSTVIVKQSFIEGNSSQGGSSAVGIDGASDMTLWKSFVVENSGGVKVIGINGGSSASIGRTTFARNQFQTAVLYPSASSLNLFNSIVWEDSGYIYTQSGAGASFSGDCILAHETSSINAATDIELADPLFVDAADGDYHLRKTSPAIDRCPDQSSAWLSEYDADGDPTHDNRTTPDASGIADAGADEQSTIFSDGFESGSDSAWS